MNNKVIDKNYIKNIYKNSIHFQILEWYVNDIYDEEIEMSTCRVNLFGRTEIGDGVCLQVKGFMPSYYVKVPSNWKLDDKNAFLNKLGSSLKGGLSVENCKLVKRKVFYGYRGKEQEKFIHLHFIDLKSFYWARKILGNPMRIGNDNINFTLYEEGVDPVLQAIHSLGYPSVGWISFEYNKGERTRSTSMDIEYTIDKKHVSVYNNEGTIAPYLQMSYDIECYSDDPGKFPIAENKANSIIGIGMTFQVFGSTKVEQVILALKKCSPINEKGVKLYHFLTEKELLLKFVEIVKSYNPDIIYSYNGHRFDDSYLYQRAELLGISGSILSMSRFDDIPGTIKKSTFSSSAYGTSNWEILTLPGVINFDLYVYINREYKLDSYKMDHVAEHFLGESINEVVEIVEIENECRIILNPKEIQKCHKGASVEIEDSLSSEFCGIIMDVNKESNYIVTNKCPEEVRNLSGVKLKLKVQKNPMGPKNIFSYYKEGNPDKIRDIAKYCLMDTLIPIHLSNKLNIFLNNIGMASVTYVPFRFLIERGQQIKVYSQLLKETKQRKYVIPKINFYQEKFEGATVLDAQSGFFDCPVVVLDFASLYPSIIRAHNLCYSSIVLDSNYLGIEGVEYKEFSWEDDQGQHTHNFVQNEGGILPDLLKSLIEERTKIRKNMKLESDPFKIMVMNGFQLALKISANSIYGFLSAQMLQCTAIASCVTYIGRQMIKDTKSHIDDNFTDFKTIYGDSVSGDTVLTLKNNNGETVVKTIEDLFTQNRSIRDYKQFKCDSPLIYHNTKQQVSCPDYNTLTSTGYSPIVRVIRHKTKSKMYRITTQKGVVTVTGDHSLLDKKGNIIKVGDCVVGVTKLLHSNSTTDGN